MSLIRKPQAQFLLLKEWYEGAQGRVIQTLQSAFIQRELRRLGPAAKVIDIHPPVQLSYADHQVTTIVHDLVVLQDASNVICADPDALPLADHQYDLIVLHPNMIQFEHLEAVLKQCYRCLKSEGSLMVFGLNPWSLWGLQRFVSREAMWPILPCFTSIAQVSDRARWAGFSQVKVSTFSFRRFVRMTPNQFMKRGALPWFRIPWGGNMFCCVASKYERRMRLIPKREDATLGSQVVSAQVPV